MAVVGQGFAIVQRGNIRLSGFSAFLAWAAVHLWFLAQPGLRLSVFVQWLWFLITGQRGSRLIVNHGARDHKKVATEHETPNNAFEQVKS